MKRIPLFIFTMLVLALFAGSGFAQQKNRTRAVIDYNPHVTYAGDYRADLLFTRDYPRDNWHRRPHMDLLQSVSCRDALDHLTNEGKWQGVLDKYGSCGSYNVEAPEWAVGNRLNYDESRQKGAN